MGLDGVGTTVQLDSDRLRRSSARDQAQHLRFGLGQRAEGGGPSDPGRQRGKKIRIAAQAVLADFGEIAIERVTFGSTLHDAVERADRLHEVFDRWNRLWIASLELREDLGGSA